MHIIPRLSYFVNNFYFFQIILFSSHSMSFDLNRTLNKRIFFEEEILHRSSTTPEICLISTKKRTTRSHIQLKNKRPHYYYPLGVYTIMFLEGKLKSVDVWEWTLIFFLLFIRIHSFLLFRFMLPLIYSLFIDWIYCYWILMLSEMEKNCQKKKQVILFWTKRPKKKYFHINKN